MNRALIIGGFALLSTVALAGWVRKPAQPVYPVQNAGYMAPWGGATPYGAGVYGAVPQDQFGYPMYGQAWPVRATDTVYRTQPSGVRTVVQQQPSVRRVAAPARTAVVRKRPTSHSVAIVAGSAGAGAAIGGLAAGGKGAGIGAIAGGAAGLLYDRLTQNK